MLIFLKYLPPKYYKIIVFVLLWNFYGNFTLQILVANKFPYKHKLG